MGAELTIYNALRGLVGGRVYPDHLPQRVEYPAIRYIRIGGRADSANCAYDITPRVQIDVYAAQDAAERLRLEQAVLAALEDLAEFEAVLQAAPVHSFDFEVKRYRSTLDYLVF